MTHPRPRAFLFGIAVALAAFLLLSSLPVVAGGEESSSNAAAPTDAECRDRWAESEADETCRNESVTADGAVCRIEAECELSANSTSLETHADAEIQAAPDEVPCLYNFNGALFVGNC